MRNARRDRRRKFQIELLEVRQMLAADYLYSLTPRAGVPDSGFGFSHAANEQFHVVSNFAYQETFHLLTEAPDYESFFYGEIQIHDATTGDLLRTIQNPLPYGHGYFGDYGEFNFALIAPNSFGYSIDIHDNLILVGSPGWEGDFDIPPEQGDHDTGGRAFLFVANTGNLLHTFDGSFEPVGTQGRNNDGFGRSVAIDGSRIAIGAHGPTYEDGESQIWDTDPGRAYVYNATTRNLITTIESPYASPVETINFGATVSLSDGKLVVTEAGEPFVALSSPGPTRVYDAESGGLLHTLLANGNHQAVIKGNDIAVGVGQTFTHLFNATSGAITQTFAAQLYDFDGNLIVSGPASGDLTTFLAIRDFPSGNVLYSVPQPPDFVEAYWEYNQIPQVFENRLLVPGRHGATNENAVFVYSVTDGPNNSPPTDIALSNDSVLENSANGAVVGALTATDPTPNETLTFSLVNSASGRFAVNGTNLVVANGSLLNFEANDSHSLTVRVTDSAGNTYDEAFTINVTDVNEAATVISINPASESENTTNGAVVGSLFSNDFDAADPETFELLDGAGGRFEQVGLEIRVADASLLDFETASSHQINVRVTDSVGHVLEQLVSINIVDFNYAPTDILLSDNSVDEASITVLRNSSANRPNGFGARIASTDSRLLVAHRSVSPTETYNGWVYLYDAANQNLLATLSNPSGVPGDRFGQSIAISDSYTVIGAGGEDVAAEDSGRAYVYDATTGALLHMLDNPDQTATSVDDEFGSAVSISGTVIAIHSNSDFTVPSGGVGVFVGAVHLFDAVSGSLLTTILHPDPVHNGNFGGSISMAGNRILIGATGNGPGIASGLAYLYEYNSVSATATYLSTLVNPTPGSFDNFGLTVAATSSVLAVGAPRDNAGAADSGRVYLFNATTGALLHTLQNPSDESGDEFGISLTALGDLVIIGARDNTGGAASGQSYVFSATTGTLLATIGNPTPAAGDLFGVGGGVAVNSTHVIVGATGDDADGIDAGIVYLFDLPFHETIGSLSGVDPEPTESFSFSLTDDAGGRFTINGNDLVVADPTLFDFESVGTHDVTVQATDSGGLTFSKTFTIQVTDVAESTQFVNGTSGDDSYAVLYSSTDVNSGTVTVQVSTNGGPVTTIGTFPMSLELYIDGLEGADSVLVQGTNGSDTVSVETASKWTINSSVLVQSSIETRVLGGGGGNDQYFFDVDSPLGMIRLIENAVVGIDRLDFSPTTTVAVAVNISLNGPQAIHPTNLSLDLVVLNTIENLIGGSMNDVLIGNTLANTITGGPGNDTLTGAGGNDLLYGGTGDDKFVFNAVTSAEADYVAEYFNQGTDTITFASMPINVSMDLNVITLQTVHVGRTLTLASAITVENLIGGAGNDSLLGNELQNALTGGPGGDVLNGRGGSDVLSGGLDNDIYAFGNAASVEADSIIELDNQGNGDSVRFQTVAAGVTLNLGLIGVQPIHLNRTLQLSSGNAIETVFGGPGNDVLTGNGLANFMVGAGGNDVLDGRGGGDSLHGGLGNDAYVFTPAAALESDYVAEMPDEGTDTVDFSTITTPVTYDATITQPQSVHLNRSFVAQVFAVSIENIIGGSANDVLTGNTFANTITGGPGNDTLTGADGNDLLYGGTGDDELIGGTGNDTYYFDPATSPETELVSENANEGTDTINFAAVGSDIAFNAGSISAQGIHANRTLTLASGVTVENIIGGSANDVLTGNTFANTITGGPGNDAITGAGGNDSLYGGIGNDTYRFHAVTSAETDFVAEYLNQGTDTLDFSALSTSVTLGLNTNSIQAAHTNRTVQLNQNATFENLIGGSGNDFLTGNVLANTLTGNAGNDLLAGNSGTDLLLGNAGNDLLFGDAGSDSLIGGSGDDSYHAGVVPGAAETDNFLELPGEGIDGVYFFFVSGPVTFSLAIDTAQAAHQNRMIQLNSVSTFENLVGGDASDTLSGNDLPNQILGRTGNDTLSGGGGNDDLRGNQGNDTYIFAMASSLENDLVTELPNQGTDTLDFSALSAAVTLSLNTNSIQTAHTNRTVQLNQNATFENVIGGSGSDTLTGNSVANILVGNDGSDSLLGGDGRDILIGGLGGDSLNGGLADDVLIAGRTLSDASIAQLIDLQTQWVSANTYSTRITNLRAGVGASLASLQAGINVLNDSGAIDTLTGAADTDWYFRALDDVITDLFAGEIEDLL